LIEIEQSVSRLSREEQLWLVDRIIHNIKLNTMKEIANKKDVYQWTIDNWLIWFKTSLFKEKYQEKPFLIFNPLPFRQR
jgi:hypothetical protein